MDATTELFKAQFKDVCTFSGLRFFFLPSKRGKMPSGIPSKHTSALGIHLLRTLPLKINLWLTPLSGSTSWHRRTRQRGARYLLVPTPTGWSCDPSSRIRQPPDCYSPWRWWEISKVCSRGYWLAQYPSSEIQWRPPGKRNCIYQ